MLMPPLPHINKTFPLLIKQERSNATQLEEDKLIDSLNKLNYKVVLLNFDQQLLHLKEEED